MPHDTNRDRAEGLLAPLLDEATPPPPPAYHVGEAIRSGRRKIRRRRIGAATGVAAVTLLAVAAVPSTLSAFQRGDGSPTTPSATASASAPAPPTSCQIFRVVVPAASYQSIATAADPTGRYIAGRVYYKGRKAGAHDVVIWDDGTLQVVDMPGLDGSFTDINAHGVAIGYSYTGESTTTAWIYRNGELSRLPGDNVEAYAINDRGDVVGVAKTLDGDGVAHPRPVVWRAGANQPTPLPLPTGITSGRAADIDTDGTIVGHVGPYGEGTGYVWLPDGTTRRVDATKLRIRQGWVVGVRFSRSEKRGDVDPAGAHLARTAVRINLRTNDVQTYPDVDAHLVNRHGWMVTRTSTPADGTPKSNGDRTEGRPGYLTFRSGARTFVLPSLTTGNAENPNEPVLLSDDGRTIVGTDGEVVHGQQPVIWHCR